MSLIESLIADVTRHEADLKHRLDELKAETHETKKMLGEVARHRKRLVRDHGRGENLLPLGEPESAGEPGGHADPGERPPGGGVRPVTQPSGEFVGHANLGNSWGGEPLSGPAALPWEPPADVGTDVEPARGKRERRPKGVAQ